MRWVGRVNFTTKNHQKQDLYPPTGGNRASRGGFRKKTGQTYIASSIPPFGGIWRWDVVFVKQMSSLIGALAF